MFLRSQKDVQAMMEMLRKQESQALLGVINESRHNIHQTHQEIAEEQERLRYEQESRAGKRTKIFKLPTRQKDLI